MRKTVLFVSNTSLNDFYISTDNPSVTFNTSNHIIVTENSKMTLLCNSDGNPLVKEMQIENERNQVLTHCRQSICKLTILKIQRAAAGLYKCSAINAIGTADTVVHVNVTCKYILL